MDAGLNIASICIHHGEEPVISGKNGICNIFFSGCNMRCLFCQNHEISRTICSPKTYEDELSVVLEKIARILSQGINAVGFVSPSHMVPQVKLIIKGLNAMGLHPVTVYNTNGYDKPETIRSLEGLIDVYLPDYKYVSTGLAAEFSGSRNYPTVALKAIKEMYYQKGSSLRIDEEGRAECGLLIRHLVLPGHVEESKDVLRTIAEELSTGVHISLMSQYHPTEAVLNYPPLNRPLYKEEYDSVAEEMHNLGFRNGWVQDMDSFQNYLPDFKKDHPFE
jgi:putative pyruvate formate lyase activating enzyme